MGSKEERETTATREISVGGLCSAIYANCLCHYYALNYYFYHDAIFWIRYRKVVFEVDVDDLEALELPSAQAVMMGQRVV